MSARQSFSGIHNARIHCSIENDELRIYPASEPPEIDLRHNRMSLDGVLQNCCSPSAPFRARVLSLYDVLSASFVDQRLSISCVRRKNSKKPVKTYVFDAQPNEDCQGFVKSIWAAAYRSTPTKKRVKVLLNPFGGSGKAKAIWNDTICPIFNAAHYVSDVQETQHSGHAAEIAESMQLDKYDIIACVSGDGLPHEVINGLSRREDAGRALKVPIAFIPAGSGNGSSKSIYDTNKHVECALSIVKGVVTPIDLMSMTQGGRRFMSYFSTSYGVIADCDVGTEHLRWMGELRFTVGVVQRIFQRTCYPCTLSLSVISDDKDSIRREFHARNAAKQGKIAGNTHHDFDVSKETGLPALRYGSVNDPVPDTWTTTHYPKMGTFYAGLMPYMSSTTCFFPTSTPATGLMDVMHMQGNLPFFSALNTVVSVEKADHFNSKYCYYAKCDAFRLTPEQHTGHISVDGESVAFQAIQGEVHQGLGRIITKNGQFFSEFSE